MKYNIYWGDMHCNVRDRHMDSVDKIYEEAYKILDFFPVAYYPFYVYEKNGFKIETIDHEPKFDEHWERIRQCVKKWNEPGRFITFMGYEWHGDRTYYGDHNVIYFSEDAPLNPTKSLLDLYKYLHKEKGIAIPHHTAYQVGMRGKNWDYFDEMISPFAEIYSTHGSSEGCNTPYTLSRNISMGPRTSGGSIQDGLKRGYHFGIICSGDNHNGFAGCWGNGLMAVCAEELTRESLWDAFIKRRVYGVTGDRIKLDFEVNGAFMGSVVEEPCNEANIKVSVAASSELDRIEIIRNNRVVYTYCHQGQWQDSIPLGKLRFKQRISFGAGPVTENLSKEKLWNGHIEVSDGKILSVEPCFSSPGQSYSIEADNRCSWKILTQRREKEQALIVEIEADSNSLIKIEVEGRKIERRVAEALEGSQIVALVDECKKEVEQIIGLKPEEVENIDSFWHNAYKAKIHKAVPEVSYVKSIEWTDKKLQPGENYYYARISQTNGQMAWSSPIWVKK